MRIKNSIFQTLHSLARHKLRSLLSILGIVFAVCAVVSMLSIGEGAKKEILDQINELGKNSIIVKYSDPGTSKQQSYSLGLSMEDAALIKKNLPEINVASSKEVLGLINEKNANINASIIAATPSYRVVKNLHVASGRFICDLDIMQKNLTCVIGKDIANDLGLAGHIGSFLNINDKSFRVVGILSAREYKKKKNSSLALRDYNKSIFIPMNTDESITADLKSLDEITLNLPKGADHYSYSLVVDNILKKNHRGVEDFQIIIPQELLRQEQKAQNTFNFVLGAIAAISLIVGGIGIMNIMLAIVSERVKEIGILRALGASKKHILLQFVLETLTLTTCGTIIGIFLGIAAAITISYFADWNIIISFWSLIIASSMSSFVGIISGLYPAYKAATLDPIQALRQD